MNASSAVVLAVVLAFAALAVRRCLKKGTPCECGGSRRICGGACRCCSEGPESEREPAEGQRRGG
ncbi:MAG: hypothetical protein IJI73_06110 [Kiritimatiellae bacterium]|nr:hypothetical protein [Kiritimatiellia bacterium]